MQVGMVWYEAERITTDLSSGVYETKRVYTNVYDNGNYEYITSYNRIGDL